VTCGEKKGHHEKDAILEEEKNTELLGFFEKFLTEKNGQILSGCNGSNPLMNIFLI